MAPLAAQENLKLTSGKVELEVGVSAAQTLHFNVTYQGKAVIFDSPLGLNVDNKELGEKVILQSVLQEDPSHAILILINDRKQYYLEARAFPDGIAFRYCLPATGPKGIFGESTAFTFPSGTKVWYASGPFQYGWLQAFQERYTDKIEGELLAPPATFQLPDGTYAALTEANLFDYHGAVMFGSKPNQVRFEYVDNEGHLESGIVTGLPHARYWHSVVRNVPWIAYPKSGMEEIATPWRVLMLAPDLNGLYNNGIIAKVADKPNEELFPKGADTEWIKPGRSLFTWMVEDTDPISVDVIKRYVKGAAELGLESVVVDDGWEKWATTEKNADGRTKWDFLAEVTEYAKEYGVDIWVWRSSSPRYRNVTDIGLEDYEERANFMKKCAELGVKGLKIDFLHTENLYTVRLMENILKDAAKNKLMVIFHGVNKPTGDSYTYPNLLAKEAVRGLECVGGETSWAPGPPWPYHNTVLPFTRWLAGGADYTPMNFREYCDESVTFGFQVASIYMYNSPMLIFSADLDDMLTSPARSFIEEVPVIWDETIVLPQSKIGEVAAMARRKGDVWYLTVVNGMDARSFETVLNFLPKGKYNTVTAYDKADNRRKVEIKRGSVSSGQKLKEQLLSGGGFVTRFTKK